MVDRTMAEQASFGQGNIQVLVKDATNVSVQVNGADIVSLYVPPFRTQIRGVAKVDDLSLLLATTAITQLTGRDDLWQDCLTWCHDSSLDPISIRCITGQGGSGKTRFALELMTYIRTLSNWDARFVRFKESRSFDLWGKTGGPNHVLLIFDYAADNASSIADSLRAFVENPPQNPARKLRVLLLARTASWDSGWLAQFKPRNSLEYSQRLSGLFHPEEPIELKPLTVEDRIKIFEEAHRAAANALKLKPLTINRGVFQTKHADTVLKDPLTLIMAAVVGLRNGVPQALSLTRLDLAYEVADLLVSRRLEAAFTENPKLALHMVAYGTLTGGLLEEDALRVLHTESVETHLGESVTPANFLDRLAQWFPGKVPGVLLGAIEPDIVGEAFVLGKRDTHLVGPERTILRAMNSRSSQVLQFLIRATQDFCFAETDVREEPLQWLSMLIAEENAEDMGLMLEIISTLPNQSVVLRPYAFVVHQKFMEQARGLFDVTPEQERSDDLLSLFAQSCYGFSIAQSEVGQREAALATAEEAMILRRQLVGRNRDAYLPDLAASLNNLANRQSGVGQREAALATAEEAMTRYRELVGRNRDAYLPDLATSLNNLATMQSEVGQREAALATAEEAMTLYRELAGRSRDAYLPDLAMSLNNLANSQSEVGQREAALATAEEAMILRRELVGRNRDAYLPDLALSSGTLGSIYLTMERHEEAAESFREGLDSLLDCIEEHPLMSHIRLAFRLLRSYWAAIEQGGLPHEENFIVKAMGILGPYLEKPEGEEGTK